MTLPRFYAPDMNPGSTEALLRADEARHLTRVMRLTNGDEIAIFDGRGHEFRGRIIQADRDRVRVELVGPLAAAPEAHIPITLVQAILKGDKMDDVVRDATMMGVAAIAPVVTARTIARRQSVDRWERVAVASAKQCRRAVVPTVAPIAPIGEWLGASSDELKILLVEPTVASGAERSMRALLDRKVASVAVIVGPEGGWTPEERDDMVARGCTAITLGALTLRADAVPLTAIALMRFAFGDL